MQTGVTVLAEEKRLTGLTAGLLGSCQWPYQPWPESWQIHHTLHSPRCLISHKCTSMRSALETNSGHPSLWIYP